MATRAKKTNNQDQLKSTTPVLARGDDGTIQLTLTIPFDIVNKIRELVITKLIEDLTVPGFRKGKAPTDVAMQHIDKQTVYEATLQNVLPEYYAKAVTELNLSPVLAPRFELLSVEEDKDWEVRAITCELPKVELGDYKKKLRDASATASIWVPGRETLSEEHGSESKGQNPSTRDTRSGPSREEKEQEAIKSLVEKSDIKVPALLVEEEVNHRLSQLLDQVQKLGLTVEQYLASTGRSIDDLRRDYQTQATDSIKLVLVLNKVAEEEKITIEDKEIEEVIEAGENALSKEDKKDPRTQAYIEDQKRMVRSVLLRRKALDRISSLI